MPNDLAHVDRVVKALADPTRIRLLALLLAGDVCVCHLYEALRIPQAKTSRHLAYLRRAGLVQSEKRGLWVYYRLAPQSGEAQAVVDAVHRWATNIPAVRRDIARLETRTGCCVPVPTALNRPAQRPGANTPSTTS